MNKLIIVLIIFCISAFAVKAQDIIILKNGNELKGKVKEIAITEIKYTKTIAS